jgi:[ribosomal protein S5]-alanine N-acetyltransferase
LTYPIRIIGDQVVLREFTLGDIDDVLAIIGDDDVTTWLSFDSRDRAQAATMIEGTIERAQQEPRTEFYLGVTRRDDDHVIGFIRIGLSGVQAGKLGYAITAAIGPDNAASIAVVQQLGFTREGVLRDHVFTNGAWRDSVLYSVLAQEWWPR